MNIRLFSIYAVVMGKLLAGVDGNVQIHGMPATKPDEKLYLAAARSFQGGHWATSSRWFNELITRFPDSSRRTKATLLLGQSLFQQENYREAYGILSNNRLAAGELSDEYLYWMAECRLGQGNLDAANQVFAELLRGFPKSPRVLEATVASAFVAAEREDWVRVVALLRPAEGVFQVQAGNGFEEDVLQEGGLLLAEALLEQKTPEAARLLLDKFPRALQRSRGWRRDLLKIRLDDAMGHTKEALEEASTLRDAINNTEEDLWFVQVVQLQSQLLEGQEKWIESANIYNSLIDHKFDIVTRQKAYFESARLLYLGGDRLSAIKRLELLFGDLDLKPAFSVTHCILGEAKLQSNRYEGTAAVAHFNAALDGPLDENLRARALWGLGRSYRSLGDMAKSSEYYFKAIEAPSSDLLRARILYDDSYMKIRSKRWLEASEGFKSVITLGDVGTPTLLMEQARLMQIKSALGSTNLVEAISLLQQIRNNPGLILDEAILLMAQAHAMAENLNDADEFLVELTGNGPSKILLAAAELENIQIHVKKERWTEAITLYNKWLKDHVGHEQISAVRLDRAWALVRSGQVSDAASAYDEIINKHSGSFAAYAAKMWKADRMFNSKADRLSAERLYQEIAGSTNTPPRLRQRAQMMSGRAAVARQGYDDARKSFSALLDDANVTGHVRAEATFALGDLTLIDLGAPSAEALGKLTQSTNAFFSIIESSPSSVIAARAWGRIGDSCRLMATERPDFHEHALQAYQNSLAVSVQVPADVKSQAHMGLAYALEQFGTKGGVAEGSVAEAMDHVLAVFYGRHLDAGQKQDPYWRGQSGLAALRLVEKLKQYGQGVKICDELERSFPGMRPGLVEKRKQFEKLMKDEP